MGILSSILSTLSPTERKLLVLLGLMASKKVKTKGEREIREYTDESYEKIDRAGTDRLEKRTMEKRTVNAIRDALGKINASKLTVSQIKKRVENYVSKMEKMSADGGVAQTNQPEQQEFSVYSCPTCGFTVDASKEVLPGKLKCPICETVMRGLKRSEFHTKNNATGFNTVDEAADIPETPKVKS